MPARTDITFRPVADSFELDDEIVLFSSASRNLYVLNQTAGLVWQGIVTGLSIKEIAKVLCSASGRRNEDVVSDCIGLVTRWKGLGLVASEEEVTAAAAPRDATADESGWRSDAPEALEVPRIRAALCRRYRVVDFGFCLDSADGPVERSVHDFLDHIRITDAEPARHHLNLIFDGVRWSLHHNGGMVGTCTDGRSVVPMVHAHLMMEAYRSAQCLLALHAAAVGARGRSLLLAGMSGSGKSTLTAALLAHGFEYLADDTVLLTLPPVRVRGVPMRVGLKEGSWEVVQRFWPELDALPIHDRPDGKRVRYLQPPAAVPDTFDRRLTGSVLVFPQYACGAETRMKRIGRADALAKLTEAGYDVPDLANREVICALVSWMAQLDCYELRYSELSDAVASLGALMK